MTPSQDLGAGKSVIRFPFTFRCIGKRSSQRTCKPRSLPHSAAQVAMPLKYPKESRNMASMDASISNLVSTILWISRVISGEANIILRAMCKRVSRTDLENLVLG